MITFQTTAVIKAPVEKVFAYVSDPKRIPEWRRDVPKVSEVKGQVQVGTTFFEEVNFLGTKQLLMKVTELVSNKKLVIEAQGGMSLLPTQSFIFTPEGHSTRIYLSVTIKTSGVFGLLGFMLKSRREKTWKEYFLNLDSILGKSANPFQ
ncbi:MAG: hypothetical protein HW412_464 [Bacteroidetes bacterium]|nr:hypothetical protein [Bacteroidota bacterium]